MPYPTQGQITQGYGASGATVGSWTEAFNKGIDIGAPTGTPVYSTVPGTVIYVGDDGSGWGTRVIVQDAYGNIHSYGHLSATNVEAGDQVYGGTNLGAVGNTGLSTGPHLSYDVSDSQGNYFDPAFIIEASSPEAAEQALGTRGQEGQMTPDPFAGSTAAGQAQPAAQGFPSVDQPAGAAPPSGIDRVAVDILRNSGATDAAIEQNLGYSPGTLAAQYPRPAPPRPQPNTQVIDGVQYTYDQNGNIIDQRVVPSGGGARGSTPEEIAVDYARIDMDQRELDQRRTDAQRDYDLAVRSQNFDEAAYFATELRNIDNAQATLDYNYAALEQTARIAYDQMAQTLGRDEADRQFQAAQQVAQQQFIASESAAQRGFVGGENALDRQLQVYMQQDAQAYQSGENSADRELRLQMQANDLGFAREQLDFAKYQFAAKYGLEKAYFDLQKGQLTLQAAAQFAELISSTDPQAVNAFLLAGGGNISNALASGATAVSNEAMLPAAMTLRQAREYETMQAPELPPYPTSTAPQGNFIAPQAPRPSTPATYAPAPALSVAPTATPAAPPGGVAVPSAAAAPASASPQTQLQVGAQVNPSGTFTGDEFSARRAYVNAAAQGNPTIYAQSGFSGTVTQPTTFVAGEPSATGQPRPEQVTVRPLTPQSQAYMAQQTAAYQPEIGEVRALRESTPVNPPVAGGYYNVAFRTVAPTQQELYMKSLQTRYGVPIRDVIAEANRYALSGIRRGGIRVGY